MSSRVMVHVSRSDSLRGAAARRPQDEDTIARMGLLAVFSQFKQVLDLPTSFPGYGGVGVKGAGGSMDRL